MTQSLEFFGVERTINQLSMAVRLLDDYTASTELLGSVSVFIKDPRVRAVKNLSGYYLFMDLPVATYGVVVETDYYLGVERSVDLNTLDPASPVVTITLTPHRAYPFPAGATIIRAVVREPGGGAIQGAAVQSTLLLPAVAVKARVNQGGTAAGDTSMRLVNIAGVLQVGDLLMVKDANASRREFVSIAAPLPADPAVEPFNLVTPLTFAHAAGTPLHMMAVESTSQTQTTETGEVVVYFGLVKASTFLTRLTIGHPAYHAVEREVEVHEGRMTSLGIIQLPPV